MLSMIMLTAIKSASKRKLFKTLGSKEALKYSDSNKEARAIDPSYLSYFDLFGTIKNLYSIVLAYISAVELLSH